MRRGEKSENLGVSRYRRLQRLCVSSFALSKTHSTVGTSARKSASPQLSFLVRFRERGRSGGPRGALPDHARIRLPVAPHGPAFFGRRSVTAPR
jgi:hypothetical protein